jgi:SepF-like predicted cell division protein (DUF552 family)
MRKIIEGFRRKFTPVDYGDEGYAEEEYMEIDVAARGQGRGKVIIRTFTLEDFSDVKEILEVLREGNTVALINMQPLKEKDLIELKRAISKLKKTCDAIEGDIAGFGDDYLILAPDFAEIYRDMDSSFDE